MELTDKEKLTPIGPPMQLHQLTTPHLEEAAKTLLHKHGCIIAEHPEECIIMFPEGTICTEQGLRTLCEHREIQLPDGYLLYEDYDRWRNISLLWYLPE